jgi:hypothetical protein
MNNQDSGTMIITFLLLLPWLGHNAVSAVAIWREHMETMSDSHVRECAPHPSRTIRSLRKGRSRSDANRGRPLRLLSAYATRKSHFTVNHHLPCPPPRRS